MARDLLMATRIGDAARRGGREVLRVDGPSGLPAADTVEVVFVDWSIRSAGWADALRRWCDSAPESRRPRLILYGPHTDVPAHREAAEQKLGPMWARSKLVAALPGMWEAPEPAAGRSPGDVGLSRGPTSD